MFHGRIQLCSSWCLFITGYESCLSKCHSWWNWNIPKDLHLLHHSSHFMKHNRISMNFYLLPPKILPQKSQPNQSASKARHRIVRGFVPRHPTHHGGVKAMAHPGPTTRSSKWPQCIWIATFSWEQNGTKNYGRPHRNVLEMSCRSCAQLLSCQSWNRISLHFTNQRLQTNRLLHASRWHKTWSLIAKW